MTDGEIFIAAKLRIDGKSWQEIAERLPYSSAHISHTVRQRVLHGPRNVLDSVIYPHIREAIRNDYFGSVGKFAAAIGDHRQWVFQVLQGDAKMPPTMLARIQEATGLSDKEILERDDGLV